ncbi:MAG: diacylglycerol kinase family lipid kinase [Bacteroidetes bacterium]|nr:diacylglycerol kinase family lipid kinase [Bacteroidota bacterium]
MKKIIFIVNPISGIGKQKGIEKLIGKHLDASAFEFSIIYTEKPGHAAEISKDAINRGLDAVIAVGGDGTVNETARGIIGSETALGIIPTGSGNGLSRHLKIPMNPAKAIRILNQYKTTRIDTATLNDNLFVSVAGVGFDARVAKEFAKSEKRGFGKYFNIATTAYANYKPRKYTMVIDGQEIIRKALMISFANSNQFGNNTSIDPNAKLDDGFIDVCIVSKVPYWKTVFLAPLLFMKRFDLTSYVEIIQAKDVELVRKKGKSGHLDGDPFLAGKNVHLKIQPLSLKVIIP